MIFYWNTLLQKKITIKNRRIIVEKFWKIISTENEWRIEKLKNTALVERQTTTKNGGAICQTVMGVSICVCDVVPNSDGT